ncbi:MAG: hypothetical protein AAF708_05015 [Deinococcota bacterium]
MVQTEGLDAVFEQLERIGATAIALSPYVAEVVPKDQGKRVPDLHVDGYRRLLARPAFGQREQVLHFHLAYTPNLAHYQNTPYRSQRAPLTEGLDQNVPYAMIAEAKRRGLECYLQIHPLIPSDVRPEHQPVYPDGSVPQAPQVSLYGNPTQDLIRAYALALVQDTLEHFPMLDGLFVDWLEYGAYNLKDLFSSLDPASADRAHFLGYNWSHITHEVTALWRDLHHLEEAELKNHPEHLAALFATCDGWQQLCAFKADIITGLYREIRDMMDQLSHRDMHLMARGWPPPWNHMSGLWYEKLIDIVSVATPKLFAFDYMALPRWYAETLQAWNPQVSETSLLDAVIHWLELNDSKTKRRFNDYYIPTVDEPQPLGVTAYQQRIKTVQNTLSGKLKVQPFAHAHMPDSMWKAMLTMLEKTATDGFWVQMYGYLGENKLAMMAGQS